MGRLSLLLVPVAVHALLMSPARPAESTARRGAALRTRRVCASESAGNGDEPVDEGFSSDLYAELRRMGGGGDGTVSAPEEEVELKGDEELTAFTDELYAHLGKRPEFATSEFYKGIKARVDVDDPMINELNRQRELLANTTQPNPSQGPNEVIELVLRALQDVDYPYEGHGVEVLINYTGTGSSISPAQGRVTPEMLLKYFETSKYNILLKWCNIQYLRKLDVSLDNKRAFQPLKLKSMDGRWVPVTFQLSKYDTPAGETWLIDQFLVKTAERRGEDQGPLYE